MGLDSFWVKGKAEDGKWNEVSLAFDPPLDICGGIFSRDGDGSFQGKVYAEMIGDITGIDIYDEYLSNATIKYMAELLDKEFAEHDFRYGWGGNKWEHSPEQCKNLVRMWRRYADEGCGLVGWW